MLQRKFFSGREKMIFRLRNTNGVDCKNADQPNIVTSAMPANMSSVPRPRYLISDSFRTIQLSSTLKRILLLFIATM